MEREKERCLPSKTEPLRPYLKDVRWDVGKKRKAGRQNPGEFLEKRKNKFAHALSSGGVRRGCERGIGPRVKGVGDRDCKITKSKKASGTRFREGRLEGKKRQTYHVRRKMN